MTLNRRFCTAPMMDLSDRHCRMMWRQITRHSVLYTEMVTSAALARGNNPERFLDYSEPEHPIALQVGGYLPEELSNAAKMADQWGYDEINLNVGCPSDRVQNGLIGAVLMGHADKVSAGVKAMQDATSMPVTVKHRIGIDDYDSYEFVRDFIGEVSETGCDVFIIHARKAILSGLSPKENREIPPLNYPRVYQLKRDFPHLEIIINGGIKTLEECQEHLQHVDGVMVGREAYYNPMMMTQVDEALYGAQPQALQAEQVIANTLPYLDQVVKNGNHPKYVIKHLLALIQNRPGARKFRRFLSEHMHKPDAGRHTVEQALALF